MTPKLSEEWYVLDNLKHQFITSNRQNAQYSTQILKCNKEKLRELFYSPMPMNWKIILDLKNNNLKISLKDLLRLTLE